MRLACFRCDASIDIGVGHVMRCMTLAQRLTEKGWQCKFITNDQSINIIPSLSEYSLLSVEDNPQKADLLIVDHYNLDHGYETASRLWASKIMVIDDLADRKHDCDILLDQTFGREIDNYQSLVPENCIVICGSDYTLLRPQFIDVRSEAIKKRQLVQRADNILINFGSTNPNDIMQKVLVVLAQFKDWSLVINIVTGGRAQSLDVLKAMAQKISNKTIHNVEVFVDILDMSQKMVEADLAFGAGGTTSWERACLGLPTIMIEDADNQSLVAKNLSEKNAVLYLGKLANITESKIDKAFESMRDNSMLLKSMSEKAFLVCDGLGTKRVSDKIEEIFQ